MNNNGIAENPFRARGSGAHSVHIPIPCHENWENMTPVAKGRFCQSCAKQVVDFSMMTDQQVLNYFSKATGGTCGRFTADQLQRPLQPIKQEKKKAWWIAAIMPLLMMFEKAGAQKKDTVAYTNADTTLKVPGSLIGDTIYTTLHKEINGKIVDTTGLPVCGAKIKIGEICNETDSSGAFNMSIPIAVDSVIIEISAVGYNSKKITMAADTAKYVIALTPLKLEFTFDSTVVTLPKDLSAMQTLGITVIVPEGQPSIVERFIDIFAEPVIKVFPNPAERGSSISISIRRDGDYYLELLDENGKLVLVKKIGAFINQSVPLGIPQSLATGVYFIRLIDERKKKQYTSKIAVI